MKTTTIVFSLVLALGAFVMPASAEGETSQEGCTYNIASTCEGGSCTLNVASWCGSNGTCEVNIASDCDWDCQYNIASECYDKHLAFLHEVLP